MTECKCSSPFSFLENTFFNGKDVFAFHPATSLLTSATAAVWQPVILEWIQASKKALQDFPLSNNGLKRNLNYNQVPLKIVQTREGSSHANQLFQKLKPTTWVFYSLGSPVQVASFCADSHHLPPLLFLTIWDITVYNLGEGTIICPRSDLGSPSRSSQLQNLIYWESDCGWIIWGTRLLILNPKQIINIFFI